MPHVTPAISGKQGIPLGYNTPLRAISGKQNISKPQNMRPPAKQRTPASSLRGQPSAQYTSMTDELTTTDYSATSPRL